jgi:UDP-glucose 4-epimerase
VSTVLVTGAAGFIGRRLSRYLQDKGYAVRGAVRSSARDSRDIVAVGNIGPNTDWRHVLDGVDYIVHLAACVRVLNVEAVDPLAVYRDVNVAGSRRLAKQAAVMGVRRLIYLSSIKVNGEFTKMGEPFQAADAPKAEDAYGISKMEAEHGLYEISKNIGMEVVSIRPPLVYGPGVKGSFLTLLRWLERGLPLPLGAVHNRRSLVALDNLVDLIVTCLDHPAVANETFLVSDDEDLSTTVLLQRMGNALDRPARLIPVPPRLLQWGAKLFSKEEITRRLLGNLQVDISKTKERLGWVPPVSVDEGLRKTMEWYLNQR